MKKIILVITLIFTMSVSYAGQKNKNGWCGVKAGLVLSAIDGSWSWSNTPHFGAVAGIFYEHMLGSKLSVSGDLLYSLQGSREKSGDDDFLNTDLHYINLPVMANYYIFKGFAVKLGIQPGFLVGAFRGNRKVEGLNMFDLSIPMGISYDVNRFRIEARYNWGITNISRDVKESDGWWKSWNSWNSVFTVTLGYKF